MKYIKYLIIVFALFSCEKTDSKKKNESRIPLVESESPFTLSIPNSVFYKDISYGKHKRNKFDLFTLKTDEAKSLAIFIHGGGFSAGDKSGEYKNDVWQTWVNRFLANNIAVAFINYRFLEVNEDEGVIKSMNDSKRALQFMRYYAKDLKIDKNKVILMGASAGAGTSLWIGFSDDMADKNADDEILRESTRVNGVVAIETQANYDMAEWPKTTFYEYESQGMNLDTILSMTGEQVLYLFYGIQNLSELNNPAVKARMEKVDMLKLLSSGDPDFYVANLSVPYTFPTNSVEVFHHPLHAKVLIDKAISVSVNYLAFLPKMNINHTNGKTIDDFVIEKIGK